MRQRQQQHSSRQNKTLFYVVASAAVATRAACVSSSSLSPWFGVSPNMRLTDQNGIVNVITLPRGGSGSSSNNSTSKPTGETNKKRARKKSKSVSGTSGGGKGGDESTPNDNTAAAADSSPLHKKETPPIVKEILEQEDYYKILGIQKHGASEKAITKAYRRRCVQTHPDKTGGDRRAFDKVAEAYGVLSDPTKRQIYDQYGKRGLDQKFHTSAGEGYAGFSSAEELFRSFFGGTRGTSPFQQQAPRRNRTVQYQLEVTLEDLYLGRTRKVHVAPPGYAHGEAKTTSIQIPRGAMHGQSILLSGEMDFDPEEAPGDLVFHLQQRPHAVFTRKGHDLAVKFQVSLQEAIHGVVRTIRHLDGRVVTIVSARDHSGSGNPRMIETGDVQVLKGEGMPKNSQGTEFGDLYVVFEVAMPLNHHFSKSNPLTREEREELVRLLDKLEGRRTQFPSPPDSETTKYLHVASLNDFGRASGRVPDQEPTMDEPSFHPFGNNHGFFYSASSSSSGSNPFFQNAFDQGDDENMQCRQM